MERARTKMFIRRDRSVISQTEETESSDFVDDELVCICDESAEHVRNKLSSKSLQTEFTVRACVDGSSRDQWRWRCVKTRIGEIGEPRICGQASKKTAHTISFDRPRPDHRDDPQWRAPSTRLPPVLLREPQLRTSIAHRESPDNSAILLVRFFSSFRSLGRIFRRGRARAKKNLETGDPVYPGEQKSPKLRGNSQKWLC